MALTVNYQKSANRDEAYAAAKEQITPEYVDKFNIKADISYAPERGIIEANGKGFTLRLSFGESKVEVELKLSLILRPFKGKVLEAVERKLTRHI